MTDYAVSPNGGFTLPKVDSSSPAFPQDLYSLADYGSNQGVGLKAPATTTLLPQWNAPAAASGNWWDSFKSAFGTTQNPGWATGLMGVGQGIFNGWLGMQQYGLAKDKLAESKRQFELNYDAQQRMTNAQLEDRQKARIAFSPGAYESVGSYMDKHGVKGLA